MKIQKLIDIYLVKKKDIRPIEVVQFDTGIQLVFTVKDFTIPDNATATLFVKKKSGKFVYQETGITIASNTITINLDNQAITEPGLAYYQVEITDSTDVITTFTGTIDISKSLSDANAVESKTVLNAFNELTTEKIAEIEAATNEEITKIQSEYETLYARAEKSSNAIKGYASGETLTLDDISPIEHAADVWVHGKNIYYAPVEKTVNYAGLTIKAEKATDKIVIDGTATENTGMVICNALKLSAGKYTVSIFNLNNITEEFDRIYMANAKTEEVIAYTIMANKPKTFTLAEDTVIKIYIVILAGSTYNNTVCNIQIEQGTTATEYTPYIDPSTVTLTKTVDEVTESYTPNTDGTVDGVALTEGATLTTDTEGIIIECEYNQDANKVIEKLTNAIIALGGEVK